GPGSELGGRLRAADRAIVIWSGPGGRGGTLLAGLAGALGLDGKKSSGAFYLPATPNGRGVGEAWAAASDEEEANPEPIGLLVVSGDEAAADPGVRALAERAESVLATTMFQSLAVGWADLVLPGTSYLERDGTYRNLEGRLQRLRRTVIPPAPDELAWTAKLAERFGVALSPHPSLVFEELSAKIYRGVGLGELGERAPLPAAAAPATAPDLSADPARAVAAPGMRLLTYRALFSGAAVERVPELQFQRPAREAELSSEDAGRLGVTDGDVIDVRSNGTSVRLATRINRALHAGVVRVAVEHARGLESRVQLEKPSGEVLR
nr:molybdopterin-dependent oxidoreductase [Actinomycetota bacterium]